MKHLFMYFLFFLLVASFGFNVYFFQGLSSSTPYIFNINSASNDFVVHDLVGNNLYFGSSENKNDVNYRQERYMLIVMTKPKFNKKIK